MSDPQLWSIRIDFALKPADPLRFAIETALEEISAALSSFEEGKGWRIEAITEGKPDAAAVRAVLKPFKGVKPAIAPVPQKDWVAESQKGLQPIAVGPFFIHGAHDRDKRPRAKIALEIEAGMAFGTGRHETTMGCLKALLRLQKTHRFRRALDVGTGTGILAFAAWHLFGRPVLAGDNDRDAIRVARENAALNGLKKAVKVISSDGYKAKAVRDGAPYDLVIANILANPLIVLAPDLAKVLARNGRAVLSGLLQTQEKDVLAAHRAVGLVLDFRIRLGDWSVLVLKRAPKPASKKAAPKPAGRRR
jgi:ribosomal protein L11 methyltransferase